MWLWRGKVYGVAKNMEIGYSQTFYWYGTAMENVFLWNTTRPLMDIEIASLNLTGPHREKIGSDDFRHFKKKQQLRSNDYRVWYTVRRGKRPRLDKAEVDEVRRVPKVRDRKTVRRERLARLKKMQRLDKGKTKGE